MFFKVLELVGLGLIVFGSWLGAIAGPLSWTEAMKRHFLNREAEAFALDGFHFSAEDVVAQVALTRAGFSLILAGSAVLMLTVIFGP